MFAFSARLTPLLNGSAKTRGWWHNHQSSDASTLEPISSPQVACRGYTTVDTMLYDWVYFRGRDDEVGDGTPWELVARKAFIQAPQ